jgi:hypothetical protein
MRKHPTLAEQHMNRCRYFTGIQNDKCEKGIAYLSVRDSSVSPYRWPCIKKEGCLTSCPSADFPTQEEAEAYQREADDHIKKYLADIKAKRCPICGDTGAPSQVGSCVYGACGHRWYQGTLS